MILAKLLAFIRYVVTLEDVRWFAFRIYQQVLTDPEERMRFVRLFVQLLGSGAIAGWVLATILSTAAGVSTLPGSSTDTLVVVAREPGPSYNVKAFCDDPATRVSRPRMPVTEDAGRLVANRGTESINWPGQLAQVARREWIDTGGVSHGEEVEMTPAAVACFIKKGVQ